MENIINHLRNRDYMSGVERELSRIKATGEVFTPTHLVQQTLDGMPKALFTNPTKTFLEPSCGDGQMLSEVVIRKIENGSTYEQALSTVYGVDLMEDNCIECIKRLYGAYAEPKIVPLRGNTIPKKWRRKGLKAVFKVNGEVCNIVCADGLVYDYSFGEAEVVTNKQTPKEVSQLFTFDE